MDIGQIRVYMTSVVVIWPRDDLGGRPQAASDDLKRPQEALKTIKTVIWP